MCECCSAQAHFAQCSSVARAFCVCMNRVAQFRRRALPPFRRVTHAA